MNDRDVAYTMHNVLCRSVTIEARFIASSRSNGSHRDWTHLHGGIWSLATTETAGYSAWMPRTPASVNVIWWYVVKEVFGIRIPPKLHCIHGRYWVSLWRKKPTDNIIRLPWDEPTNKEKDQMFP
jgi:hypothetical protein